MPFHSYSAYGLHLRTPFPLPELMTGREGEEVRIRVGTPEGWTPPSSGMGEGEYRVFDSRTVGLSWKEVGSFYVRDGRDVYLEPVKGVADHLLRLFLLGPVLAAVLHRRGRLVLHAGAVALERGEAGEEAIAFLGNTCSGKSTTVAAFQQAGHRAITDDLVALRMEETAARLGHTDHHPTVPLMVTPGYPQLKLSMAALQVLEIDPSSQEPLPLAPPRSPRYAYRFAEAFSLHPAPLQRLYLLDVGSKIEIESLPPKEAFMEVMNHVYLSGHLSPEENRQVFHSMSQLLNRVPASRLTFPRRFSELRYVVEAVEEHQAGMNVAPQCWPVSGGAAIAES